MNTRTGFGELLWAAFYLAGGLKMAAIAQIGQLAAIFGGGDAFYV